MIKLEIVSSNDPDLIGIYNYQFNDIYIGRSKKSDLIIHDAEMPYKFLTLKFVKNTFIIQNEPNTPFYFVNGKKMSGARKLKQNDIIQFGTHKLVIHEFIETIDDQARGKDLASLYEKYNAEVPDEKFILEFIEEQILELEKLDV